MNEELELRMYSLCLYQFANSIHAGIQSYHATIEYGLKYGFNIKTGKL